MLRPSRVDLPRDPGVVDLQARLAELKLSNKAIEDRETARIAATKAFLEDEARKGVRDAGYILRSQTPWFVMVPYKVLCWFLGEACGRDGGRGGGDAKKNSVRGPVEGVFWSNVGGGEGHKNACAKILLPCVAAGGERLKIRQRRPSVCAARLRNPSRLTPPRLPFPLTDAPPPRSLAGLPDLDVVFEDRPIQRFWFLETVARWVRMHSRDLSRGVVTRTTAHGRHPGREDDGLDSRKYQLSCLSEQEEEPSPKTRRAPSHGGKSGICSMTLNKNTNARAHTHTHLSACQVWSESVFCFVYRSHFLVFPGSTSPTYAPSPPPPPTARAFRSIPPQDALLLVPVDAILVRDAGVVERRCGGQEGPLR